MRFPLDLARLALQLAAVTAPVWSVHLLDAPSDLPDSVPDACRVALSRNITCAQLISGSKVAAQVPYSKAALAKLCTTACSDSLKEFQQDVHDGCGDRILTFNGTSTTGGQLADPLVWAHNVTCLRDG